MDFFKAYKTGQILHDIEYPDNDLKDQIEMFSFQIAHHPIQFNAAGYFPINYSLLFSVSVLYVLKRIVF